MFALVVHERDRPAWRKAFSGVEIMLGSSPANDLVLADPQASPRHARIVRREGKYILVDMKSEHGTWLNGKRLAAPMIVRWAKDTFTIGSTRIEIAPEVASFHVGVAHEPRDAREAELLAAIDRGDDASRGVYADWLEERGTEIDALRAELLRLQSAAADDAARARLRHVSATIDVPWRVRLAQVPVENCLKFRFECPKRWSELQPTKLAGERHCETCRRTVYYCETIAEARAHAAQNHCVAVDVATARWPRDVEPPFGEVVCAECKLDVGPGFDYCPRCTRRLEALVTMGELA